MTIVNIKITGNTVFSDVELEVISRELLKKRVPLSSVYELAGKITERYGRAGYVLSRAIVPPQELDPAAATVRIEIIEGFVDRVDWPTELANTYRDYFSYYTHQITARRPSNIKDIERYLLLANDLPGLQFSSTFKASADTPRAATLVVTVDKTPITARAKVDNRGSEGRGPWQAQVSGTANNTFGLHEALSLQYATTIPATDQLKFMEGSWQQVLNAEGFSASLSLSYNTGIPGLPPLEAIDYETEGWIFEASLAYPILRTRDQNLSLSGTLFFEDINSSVLSTPFTNDRLRGLRSRIEYDYADAFGGINLLQATLSQGIEGLGSTANGHALASRAAGRTDFTKIEAFAARYQSLEKLIPGASVYASMYGQFAFQALLSPEQCSFGGKTFGRAFDPSSFVGDNCLNGLLEVRYDIRLAPTYNTQLFSFVDAGVLEYINTTAGIPPSQTASSFGAGVRLSRQNLFDTTVEVSRSLDGDIDRSWRGHLEFSIQY